MKKTIKKNSLFDRVETAFKQTGALPHMPQDYLRNHMDVVVRGYHKALTQGPFLPIETFCQNMGEKIVAAYASPEVMVRRAQIQSHLSGMKANND